MRPHPLPKEDLMSGVEEAIEKLGKIASYDSSIGGFHYSMIIGGGGLNVITRKNRKTHSRTA
jgi:hypothetical protein